MHVILLNGPREVGKDTLAELIVTHYNARGVRSSVLSMARPMHEEALADYGLPPEHVDLINRTGCKDTPSATLDGFTPREVYITKGNELRGVHGPDVLADMWMKQAAELFETTDILVVPDVRFQPEVKAATRLVGWRRSMLVAMYRFGKSWKDDIGSYCDHPKGAYPIINSGDKQDLLASFLKLYEDWSEQ